MEGRAMSPGSGWLSCASLTSTVPAEEKATCRGSLTLYRCNLEAAEPTCSGGGEGR